jgi:Zn-finger nucleic acid-binding protein
MYRRDALLHCPACGTLMDSQAIERAVIDVCESCGGVWADLEDGDLGTVATQAHVPDTTSQDSPPSATACPRCETQLLPVGNVGDVALVGCQKCGGTFLPRASIDAAMWLPPGAGAPPPEALAGLAAWVRRLLGRS